MIRRIRNLIGSLLLIAAIAVTQIPVTDVEAVDTASASDFQMDGTTLVKYNGTAKDVSVSNYVERIESEAFAGNEEVEKITIGESVKYIGARAFADCSNLRSVTVPDSVETIDTAAFAGCPLLQEITVGTGLQSLGNGVFAGDYSLQEVDIDSSNPEFTCNEGAIYNKDGLDTLYQVLAGRSGDSYVMPASVETVRPYAFWGDYNLQKVSISSNVTEITGYCFSNCKNLKDVAIPYSVNHIDMKAFEDCVRLREITIPPSVSTIHDTAFDGCTKLSIQAEPGSKAEAYAQTLVLEDIEVSEYEEAPVPRSDEEETQESAQEPVDYYHEVTHMNPMEQDPDDTEIKGISRVVGQQAFVLIDNAQATINVGDTGEVLGGTPEAVSIPAQAYYDAALESARFPEGTERIGEFAFARSKLGSVTIPDGVTQIGYGAFYHCDKLERVSIPDSVETIESFAFAKTPWMERWMHEVGSGSDFLIVGDGILLAYRGERSEVVIPDGVKQIGADVFREHEELTKVLIPDGVTVIGEGAFMDCCALTEVQGMNGVCEIRDRAFAGCPIRNVHIPASVEKLGLRAFDCIGTDKAENEAVVVFDGSSLPELTYSTAATKLYHDSYRGYSLAGNSIAIVSGNVNTQEHGKGTVLEKGQMGFDGTVCRIEYGPSGDQPGALRILWQNGTDTAAGRSYTIDGKTYEVLAGQEPVILDERADSTEDADSAANTQTADNAEDADNTASAQTADNTGKKTKLDKIETADSTEENVQDGAVIVTAESSFLPEGAAVTADIEGIEQDYALALRDSDTAKREIQKVYKSLYGEGIPAGLRGYELELTEQATGIPITSLGKLTMDIRMPLPEGLDSGSLHILCLNTDGLLKEIEGHVITSGDTEYLSFTARYFPYYVMYSDVQEDGSMAGGEAISADGTVTGAESGNVVAEGEVELSEGRMTFSAQGQRAEDGTAAQNGSWKWILAGGLFVTSMAVFFTGSKMRLPVRRKVR